jgi:hypothetical protein
LVPYLQKIEIERGERDIRRRIERQEGGRWGGRLAKQPEKESAGGRTTSAAA